MKCPLCSHPDFQKSWLVLEYKKVFIYEECQNCRSLICSPMPDHQMLLEMYSDHYFEEEGSGEKFTEVLECLDGLEKGVFLDYGCGDGRLLKAVHDLGWRPVGVEFNPDTIKNLKKKYPFEIVEVGGVPKDLADVIHLGDVLEHLTNLEGEMPKILSLLKTGGTFIAHAPLEANPNFFNLCLKISRKLKRGFVQSAPYHVTLATTKGQRALFNRFGLKEKELRVREISFPAPQLWRQIRGIRQFGLFAARRISQTITSLTGVENRGNRYFYIGEKIGKEATDR